VFNQSTLRRSHLDATDDLLQLVVKVLAAFG